MYASLSKGNIAAFNNQGRGRFIYIYLIKSFLKTKGRKAFQRGVKTVSNIIPTSKRQLKQEI